MCSLPSPSIDFAQTVFSTAIPTMDRFHSSGNPQSSSVPRSSSTDFASSQFPLPSIPSHLPTTGDYGLARVQPLNLRSSNFDAPAAVQRTYKLETSNCSPPASRNGVPTRDDSITSPFPPHQSHFSYHHENGIRSPFSDSFSTSSNPNTPTSDSAFSSGSHVWGSEWSRNVTDSIPHQVSLPVLSPHLTPNNISRESSLSTKRPLRHAVSTPQHLNGNAFDYSPSNNYNLSHRNTSSFYSDARSYDHTQFYPSNNGLPHSPPTQSLLSTNSPPPVSFNRGSHSHENSVSPQISGAISNHSPPPSPGSQSHSSTATQSNGNLTPVLEGNEEFISKDESKSLSKKKKLAIACHFCRFVIL
jgi:hypothetical protein